MSKGVLFPRNRFTGKAPVEPRFWAKVEKSDGCWLWTGSQNGRGYGRFYGDGQHYGAHRYSYELKYGAIPDGLTVDHLCRVRHCVNPDHMEVVTHAENLRRGEGFGVQNARKTHCPKGHPYDDFNTVLTTTGGRRCRTCERARLRAFYLRTRKAGRAEVLWS